MDKALGMGHLVSGLETCIWRLTQLRHVVKPVDSPVDSSSGRKSRVRRTSDKELTYSTLSWPVGLAA